MFFCGPATHVESNLPDDRQSGVSFNAINLGKIDPRHPVEIAVRIEGYPAAAPQSSSRFPQGTHGGRLQISSHTLPHAQVRCRLC